MIVEIIVISTAEAKLAKKYGANRLELIHTFDYGGLSPDLKITQDVCSAVDIPVNVMLRCSPHPGFLYSSMELDSMLRELEFIRDQTKANGIVFGALDKSGIIDEKALELIIANKAHLKLTFHRAIDVSADIINSYRILLDTPAVDWVLTSGGADTAINGLDTIKRMAEVRQSSTNARIIAGSGITPDNAKYVVTSTGVKEIHLGAGVRDNGKLDKTKFEKLFTQIGRQNQVHSFEN